MKKIFFYIFIFVLIGELMIRFDQSFTLMEESRVVKISNAIELTPEYELLRTGKLPNSERDLRIMVIGDSYIHGGGIEFESNFSQQLKKMLKDEKNNFDNIWVLDVSRSSSNNLDNTQSYFQFVDQFNPNIVVLGYNLNDIDGNLNKDRETLKNVQEFKEIKTSGGKAQSTIRKVYDVIYKSQFVRFTLKKAHSFIKTFGIIIPNSRFDVTMKSYSEDKKNWQKSKVLLSEMIEDVNEKSSKLIVYKFPEVNLLEHPELFSKANESIKTYFNRFPYVIYINGADVLKGEKSKDYVLSKYDGHPNEKAHNKMATHVYGIIEKNFDF